MGAAVDQTGGAQNELLAPLGNAVTRVTVEAANSSDALAIGVSDWSTYSEYGQPVTDGATESGTSADVLGYGWLGGAQRSTVPENAGLTLTSVRVYNSQRRLFTSSDPVLGGMGRRLGTRDPINSSDISGKCWSGFWWTCYVGNQTRLFLSPEVLHGFTANTVYTEGCGR